VFFSRLIISAERGLHPFTWASDVLKDDFCSESDRSIFTIGMYALWLQRNKHRHGVDQQPMRRVVQWTVDLAHDLWLLARPPWQPAVTVTKPKWRMPPEGCFKCNFDGAYYPACCQAATGAMIRDQTGTFRGGRAQWRAVCLDALTMEATAFKEGIILPRDLGVKRIQCETDSQELVKLWEMGERQRSCISLIIREIRGLSNIFQSFSLMYVHRSCNHVAHALAKQVSDSIRVGEWHSAPTCIVSLLTEDGNHAAPWLIPEALSQKNNNFF
jgi:ribonuclease HI